jgi:hypothetical protein
MDEVYTLEENIEIFHANFECEDTNQIENLYKVKKTTENNDVISKKIIKEKYNHPLFLNYNYCLFCLERRKTKYSYKNLDDMHTRANLTDIGEFLENKNIKLQMPKNKIDKISKRRFIHSYDRTQNNIINTKNYSESDTDLCIDKNHIDYYEDHKSINRFKKKRSGSPKKRNSNAIKQSSKLLSPKIEKIFGSDERKKDDSVKIKAIKRHSKINTTSTFNSRKSISKKNLPINSIKKSKKLAIKNDKNEGEQIVFNSVNPNSNFAPKSNKNVTKSINLFGFFTNYFYNDKENALNDSYLEKINESEGQSLKYFEKNEKCSICMGIIKDKFILLCGDFFCRECIINLIEECINNITMFDKIECPRCHEPINESTIKFLLTREYLEKYNKIKMKIEGLKNKNNVPCPHPDCEGFASKEEIINGTLECQNGHIFCNKCLEEVDERYRLEPSNKHICITKDKETEKYFRNNKNIRKCPQCQTWVQRDPKGCNYFRCQNIWCQYEFCWICGKKYDRSHYKNPLSMCFGLTDSNYEGKMIKSLRIRRIRCILIALLFLLILLPIIIIFFSFILIFFFIMYFQFDGKELRNVRFHSKIAHKIFYILYIAFIIFISIGLIPFGYMCLVILLLSIPLLIIINKIKKKSSDNF